MLAQWTGARRISALLFAVLLAAVMTACTVTLISPYDPVTDRNVTALQREVDKLLMSLDADPVPAYDKVKSAYDSIWVDFNILYLRNEARPKNKLTVKQLDALKSELQILEKENRNGRLVQAMIGPARNSLDQTFLAILKLELAKKET